MAVWCASVAMAQESPATAPAAESPLRARDPLATKQQIVRDRMTQLEDRMFRLIEKLAKTEPEQAARLEAAMKRAQEMLIRRNMDDAIQLLEDSKLTDAADRQAAALKGLENVLKILLEEGDNTKERQAAIDRLQTYRDRVQRLLEDERKLKARADAAPRLAGMLAAIRAAIGKLEALIDRQGKQTDQTAAAGQSGDSSAAGKLGEAQKTIREDTQDVGETLERSAAQAGPFDTETRPAPTDQPPPAAPGPSTRPEPGQADAQTPGGKPDTSGGASKDEAAIEAGVRQAREDVNRAGGEMQAAENELGRKDLPAAVPMQKKAQESLRRALEELKRQEKEARRQLDQAEAAKRQRELRQRAQDLAEQMKRGPSPQQGQPQPGNQQPGGQQPNGQQQGGPQQDGQKTDRPQEPTPGNQNVEQAGEHMDKAADELDKDQPAEASSEQQKALEQLEQAQRELEQALDQLRREQQEEVLRGLEARFRTMLAAQLLINEGTLALDQKGRNAWAHAEELKLAGLAQDQTGVAEQAGQALHILREEGTTVVFPRIVEQMREDMSEVAALLAAKKTAARTQRVQADIVVTLKELIEAVKEMRKKVRDGESPGSSGGGPNQNPPLLPGSAELKLLRSCQQRVNRQTTDFHNEHGDPEGLDAEAQAQLGQITQRQEEVAEMARKMNERITGQ